MSLKKKTLGLAVCAVSLCLLACIPPGATAAPSFKAVSTSGEVVFFETDEQLVPGDTDTKRDVYERY